MLFLGMGRFLSYVKPSVVGSLDLRGMALAVLLDRVNNEYAHQKQVCGKGPRFYGSGQVLQVVGVRLPECVCLCVVCLHVRSSVCTISLATSGCDKGCMVPGWAIAMHRMGQCSYKRKYWCGLCEAMLDCVYHEYANQKHVQQGT